MTDQTPPVQPEAPAAPATPAAPAPPVQQSVPEGYIEKDRYTGAVQKIQTLTAAQAEMQAQLTEKASAMEQLNSQLAALEAEGKTSLGAKDSKIAELQGQFDLLNKENSVLKALKMKVDAVKDMGRPDLLPLVEHLPDTADPEVLKAGLTAMANTMEAALKQQADRLLSGVIETPTISAASVPQTNEQWVTHIENLPLGSPERMKAFDDYGTFLQNQGAL